MATNFALLKLDLLNSRDWTNTTCASNNLKGFDYVTDEDSGKPAFIADSIGSGLSFVALTGVAMLIFADKRLQAHPNILIAQKCMCDAFIYFQFFTRYQVCGHHFNALAAKVYAITVQFPWRYIDSEIRQFQCNQNKGINDTCVPR